MNPICNEAQEENTKFDDPPSDEHSPLWSKVERVGQWVGLLTSEGVFYFSQLKHIKNRKGPEKSDVCLHVCSR